MSMKNVDKFNRSAQSQGNLATMATLTPSQTHGVVIGENDELVEMRLNQVRKLNRQQQDNLQSVRCRLNHISVQDQHCQKNISRTRMDINKILRTKERLKIDKEKKDWFGKVKEKKLEDNLLRVSLSRQERDLRNQRIEQQRQIYAGTHHQLHREYKNEVKMAKSQTLEEIQQENNRSHKLIRQGYLQHMQDKLHQHEQKQQMGFMNYQSQLEYEAQLYKHRQEIIQELEENETRVVNQLKITQNFDRSLSAKRDEIKKMPFESFTPKKNLFRITSQPY